MPRNYDGQGDAQAEQPLDTISIFKSAGRPFGIAKNKQDSLTKESMMMLTCIFYTIVQRLQTHT